MIEFLLIICLVLFFVAIVFVFVVMAIEGTKTAEAIDEWVAEKVRKKKMKRGRG